MWLVTRLGSRQVQGSNTSQTMFFCMFPEILNFWIFPPKKRPFDSSEDFRQIGFII